MQGVHWKKNSNKISSPVQTECTEKVRFELDCYKWEDPEQDLGLETNPWKDIWKVFINDWICDPALSPS